MKMHLNHGESGAETLEPAGEVDVKGRRREGKVRRRRKPIGRIGIGRGTARRSRPETPLGSWKFNEAERDKEEEEEVVGIEIESEKRCGGGGRRAVKKDEVVDAVMVSARKLAAGIWKSQPGSASPSQDQRLSNRGGVVRLGFQLGDGHGGSMDFIRRGDGQNVRPSPRFGSRAQDGYLCQMEHSFQNYDTEKEGATKWDPVYPRTSGDVSVSVCNGYMKPRKDQVSAVAVVSAMELKLDQARARIHELEHEQKSSKKKLESFLRNISEEKAAWRSREHEKVRALIDDMKSDLNRERKYRQRGEIINSKLVNELSEAKLSVKRYMHEYEKERKARKLVEEVCEELAKEIADDKEDAEAVRNECLKIREEVEDERRMLQMAEVWREERVQMKLVDIKVAVEEKYSQMNRVVAGLENFLKSRNADLDPREIKEAEMLCQAAASLNIRDVRDFSYEPPKAEDIFAVFEDVNMAEMQEKDIEACAYSPASNISKIHAPSPQVESAGRSNFQRRKHDFSGNNGDMEGDESGWETVSQLEDQGSSYSPDGSVGSGNKGRRNSNASGNVIEREDKAGLIPKITEITEVSPARQLKKGSSISRLWKQHPNNADNFKIISVVGLSDRLSDGRQSNGSINSLDQGSAKGINSPSYLVSWSSPDSKNPNYNKGMKGCIEWSRGATKNNLKAKLMAARIESQKVQLRQVLKQKY